MISASIAIGIAVDGTLHLCEVFREEHARGVSRRKAVAEMLANCGPALWKTVLVVSGGWLMLAGADLLLVSRFGWLMAVIVAAALVGDLILLPALLAGSLGKLLRPAKPRTRRDHTPSEQPTPAIATAVPAPHAWSAARLVATGHRTYNLDGDDSE
jgi:uncharacterized membrane protein YdfJ with MMPL/SSD domain